MIVGRQIAWFSAGFLAAAIAGLFVQATGARAQGVANDGFVTRVRPAQPQGLKRRPATPPPDMSDPAPDLPVRKGADGDPVDGDVDGESVQPAGRPVPQDGDLNWPPQPEPPRDGEVVVGEPVQPEDGSDATRIDSRQDEDVAAFERPAAGFDPDAFSVEVEPILDRRPARLFRFEPFDPVGIRWGSFIVFPELESDVAAFNNLFRSSVRPRSDISLEVRPSVRIVSAWRVHALEFRATGLTTFHNHFPGEDDRAYLLEARGRVDISKRTNVELVVSHQVDQEARGSINAATIGDPRNELTTEKAIVSFNQRFNRLSIQLRGGIIDYDYASLTTSSGAVLTNDERDMRELQAALRATWEFKPALLVFAEAQFLSRTHGAVSLSDGISRDSEGERWRLGLSFGNKGQILRGEASLGWGSQRPEDSRLAAISGVIVDANLAWRINALSSLLLTARSDIGESTSAGSGGAISRQAGIELRHAFRRDLIGTAGLRYAVQDYHGIDLSERELVAALALERYLSREIAVFARYQHTNFDTDAIGRSFDADELRIGLRIRR